MSAHMSSKSLDEPPVDPTWAAVQKIRHSAPIVHCITDAAAANFAANAVIAVGGSPVMASDPSEAASAANVADALTVVVDITVLDAIKRATVSVFESQVPWVLDLAGLTNSESHKDVFRDLVWEHFPSVIRGTASEILTLAECVEAIPADPAREVHGKPSSESVLPAAIRLALRHEAIVVIRGTISYVIDGETGCVAHVVNGHPMMAQETAMDRSLTAVLGCFVAGICADMYNKQLFWAAVHAHSFFAVAGEYAAKAKGPGSMHTNMIDYLRSMTYEEYHAVARRPIDLSLYLIVDSNLCLGREIPEIVERAIGDIEGATAVQLREEGSDASKTLTLARAVKAVCDKYGVPLIINDRVDIALEVDAAGIHIGQSELPPSVARRLLGPSKIIGMSVSTREEIEIARKYADIVDYISVGPVAGVETNSKNALSLEKLEAALETLPFLVVAIGGITKANAPEVRAVQGVHGIAVDTAITMAEDPWRAARDLSP